MRTTEASEKSFVHVLMDSFSPFSLEFESNSLHSCNRDLIPYVLEQMRWQEWCNRRVTRVINSVSVSAILSFSYKIRADVLSSALIPFVW